MSEQSGSDATSEEDDDGITRSFLKRGFASSSSTPSTSSPTQTSPEQMTIARRRLYRNFIFFCLFYSITHATVDGVLAFATAELGKKLGGDSGFALYLSYTLSALLIAKPCQRYLGPKNAVIVGLYGMLVYVGSFFLAIMIPSCAFPIFLTGASVGGIGAGVLWTAQGSYYSINAAIYAQASNKVEVAVVTKFASIFAVFYLLLETSFKLLATAIYMASLKKVSQIEGEWRGIVFGIYFLSALASTIAFQVLVFPMSRTKSTLPWMAINRVDEEMTVNPSSPTSQSSEGAYAPSYSSSQTTAMTATTTSDPPTSHPPPMPSSSLSPTHMSMDIPPSDDRWYVAIGKDTFAVCRAMLYIPKLQLMLPYQICFGLSAGFIGYYINSSIVSKYVGDGYIGILSALTAFAAMALALPYAEIANNYKYGKWYVMMFGGICFFLAGFPLLVASDQQIAHWGYLVVYFIIHGAARGAWESTNKATITEYFPSGKYQDAAFAAVYFTSGLAGAVGFLFYQYMSRSQLAILNTVVPIIAMLCYHKSYTLTRPQVNAETDVTVIDLRYGNVPSLSQYHHYGNNNEAVGSMDHIPPTVYGLNE